jgi:OmpA-OmpF porin, OOP family
MEVANNKAKKYSIRIGVCLALGMTVMSSVPAAEAGRWYVAPQVGGLITDDDRHVEDGDALLGLSVGKHLNQDWSMELNVNGAKLDAFDPYAASLDVLRVFRRDAALSPYLTFGAGAIRNEIERPRDSTDLMTQAGVGLLWQLGENGRRTSTFSVRPEIKARWDDAGRDDFVDYIAALGFQFSFGPTAPVAQPAPAAAQAIAPAPETPFAPPPPPAAPADTDRDGVVDASDRCPGTPSGVAVDEVGCTQQGKVTLAGVRFENASATLMRDSTAALDRVAADLRKYPQLQIEVQGHTDSVGSAVYNLRLSQQRADAVRGYLIEQGVRAEQVAARGYGEADPVADNATAAGRAQNRRVMMSVLKNPGSVEVKSE